MADAYSSTLPTTPYESVAAGLIPEDVKGVALAWFPKRHPIYSRFQHIPVGSSSFKVTNENFRPMFVLLDAAIASTSATSVVVEDASAFDVDDVVKIDSEYLLVTAINTATKTLTVVRGHATTTAATHADEAPVWLITNTRTGAAVDIQPISRKPTAFTQYVQVCQHAYGVGGGMASKTNFSAFATPITRDKLIALQATLDDFEKAMIQGRINPLSSNAGPGARPMMAGLESMIVSNRLHQPTSFAAYKPEDLIRDTVQACFNGGGEPDVLLVSTDWLYAFALWGMDLVMTPAGETQLGVKISRLSAPFLGDDIEVIAHPLMAKGSAVMLQSDETAVRLARDVYDKPRGSRGDAVEGDVIIEGAIELLNESHAAMVTGITGFAKPT